MTKENLAELRQKIDESCGALGEMGMKDQHNSRANNATRIMEAERLEREAERRYPDSESALEAMKLYRESLEPLPLRLSGESMREYRARLRRGCYERRRQAREAALSARSAFSSQERGEASGEGREEVAGVASGQQRVPRAEMTEEDGWVMIPTSIVRAKSLDDVPLESNVQSQSDGQSQSENEFEYQEESDEDEEDQEDIDDDAEALEPLWSICGSMPE